MDGICSVYGDGGGDLPLVTGHPAHVGSPLATRDKDGSKWSDDQDMPHVHGNRLANTALGQEPVPMTVGGGTPLGPAGKLPDGMDWRQTIFRSQRAAVLKGHKFEPTPTIGSVSIQHYQYVRPGVPYPYPNNAYGNPDITDGHAHQQIANTLRPALEAPRFDYHGQDITTLQEQQDQMIYAALLDERGLLR